MWALMKVSRTAYYHFRRKDGTNTISTSPSNPKQEIEDVASQHEACGERRLTAKLRKRGWIINHKKVLRIRQELNLTRKMRLRKPDNNSSHSLAVYANLIRDFRPLSINQLSVADITYVRLRDEFCYLAVIVDAFLKKSSWLGLKG